MLIDWFTVCAQILNFLVLVWLMKRFLYKPILDLIDAREKMVAAEIADADARKAEAVKERDEYLKKNSEFDQVRAGMMSKASDDAKTQRDKLTADAEKAAGAISENRLGLLQAQMKNLEGTLVRKTKEEVFAITRKMLSDLAATSLEERIVEVFLRRISQLTGPTKESLRTALSSSASPAEVRSAFDLSGDQKGAIQTAINEAFSGDFKIQFTISSELISGIEFASNGQKISWSVDDYLDAIESEVMTVPVAVVDPPKVSVAVSA